MKFEARSTLHNVVGRVAPFGGAAVLGWNADGTVAEDPAPAIRVEFPVDQMRSGNKLRDREMYKLVDSARFPKIFADLLSLDPPSPTGRYLATGEITFVGRKRVYSGELEITRDADAVEIDGELAVDLRDFGVAPPKFLLIKVDPLLQVHVHLVVRKAA